MMGHASHILPMNASYDCMLSHVTRLNWSTYESVMSRIMHICIMHHIYVYIHIKDIHKHIRLVL